jgi:copper homeostasis protein
MPTRSFQSKIEFELCLEDLGSLDLAVQNGVSEIELCSALDLGGVTPSCGLIREVRNCFKGSLAVLIRPRAGGFHYSDREKELMQKDAEAALALGADMVVTGALDHQNEIDESFLEKLARSTGVDKICFHRAIDQTPAWSRSLDTLLKLGIPRVLSSGGAQNAKDGVLILRAMQEQANGKMVIMAGGGIRSDNLQFLAKNSDLKRYHSSLRLKSSDQSPFGSSSGVDEQELQKCLKILRDVQLSD